MTDNKKKGDFKKGGKDDIGGDKKQRADRNEDSRTGNQNSGSGGRDRSKSSPSRDGEA